jgi:TIR domain
MGGSDWQEIMQAAIYACGCCAVFLGAQKPDNWQDAEMKLALNRKNNDKEKKFTVIPVLLDTANYDTVKDYLSTSFLGLGSWISFKHHDLEWPLFQLCCGIKREKPDPRRYRARLWPGSPEVKIDDPYKANIQRVKMYLRDNLIDEETCKNHVNDVLRRSLEDDLKKVTVHG